MRSGSADVTSGLQTANLTLMLGLALAATWPYSDRPIVAGATIALLVSIKLFVWPFAFWLLATRRYAAFAWTVLGGLAIDLMAWGDRRIRSDPTLYPAAGREHQRPEPRRLQREPPRQRLEHGRARSGAGADRCPGRQRSGLGAPEPGVTL